LKVILVNRYFFPDQSATSQLLSDLAFHLAGGAHEIHVIASRQRYDNASSDLPIKESIRGVRVSRIWTTTFGRGSLIGRAFDYLTFYASASAELLLLVREGDIVIAKTDPPMLSLVAAMVTRLRGGKLINWLQDLFPEIAAAADIGWAKGSVGQILARLRDWSLHCGRQNVVVGEKMREVLTARGIEAQKITVISNWADGDAIRPVTRAENPLRKKWGLEGKFIVGYSGNLGRVHEFDTVLGAMTELRGDEGKWFLFIGAGKQRQMMETECKARGVTAVSFLPYQGREDLVWSLGVPDVHLVTLLPQMEGLVVPSKVYGITAAGRPILNIGALSGEVAQFIHKHECGTTIEPGDVRGLVAAITHLSDDDIYRATLGANARKALENYYEMHHALQKWTKMLDTVIQQ
jgi:colanic acid biosynthesis glycosyl transferase WcaI